MKYLTVCLLLAVLQVSAAETHFVSVTGAPFVADYSRGTEQGRYGVIVLEGSRGGQSNYLAAKVAELGYPVLSLAYFGAPGLPASLQEIPLEYFDAPRQWLLQRPETRPDGVVVLGWSKGAELALLLAAHNEDYAGVVGIAPSSVVWSARRSSPEAPAVSSWSQNGKALDFVPLNEDLVQQEGLLAAFATGLHDHAAIERARIPVENIAGLVLLLSGEDDHIWPAATMGEQVCRRMPSQSCTHLRYPGAGHLLDPKFPMGGSASINAKADAAVRAELASFLQAIEETRQVHR